MSRFRETQIRRPNRNVSRAQLTTAALLATLLVSTMQGETIKVRYPEGSKRGFLVLHDMNQRLLAAGELLQTVRGDRVTARMIFRFRDGSVDEDTTTYTQRSQFRLVSEHHVQRGPSFPHPIDTVVDSATGMVTVRSLEAGKQKVETKHFDMPGDVYNGLFLDLIGNLTPDSGETTISMIAGSKPRLVKLEISEQGEEKFLIAGRAQKARHTVIKVKVGGVAGAIAPLIGKAPADIHVWTADGAPPTILRVEGQLYEEGPIWRVDLASPAWPRATP